MKKHFWKIEYSIIILCTLGLIMLLIPVHIENYIQAGIIKSWKDKYKKTNYIFKVINTQINEERIDDIKTYSIEERKIILLNLIKPYMRLKSQDKIPWRYRPKYMNGTRVSKKDSLYFNNLYITPTQQLVGIKDISETNNKAWFAIMFDINGFLPPNTWGKDIFGMYIYDEGETQPFGSDLSLEKLKTDCSELGSGYGCGYYYIIGGEFND